MIFLVIFSLLGYCFFLAHFGKQAIEFTPFLTTSVLTTLLYISAYIGVLPLAIHTLLSIGLILLLSSFYYIPKKQLFLHYLTPGFTFFIITAFLFSLMAYNTPLNQWDEFSYWGRVTKAVFYNHGFITEEDTISTGYPLGTALFYYPFFLWSNHFSIGLAYVAKTILLLAPMTMLTFRFNWQQWKRAAIALGLAIILFIALGMQLGPINSLYTDNLVGLYYGVALVFYFSSQHKYTTLLWMVPIVIALSLFKSIPRNCTMTKKNAYLFRIVNDKNKIYLENIAND